MTSDGTTVDERPAESGSLRGVQRLKIGIIGCGAIAQIQHLPHLRELDDQFAIGGLSDLSPKLLDYVGEQYGVGPERRFVDYHDLLRSGIDGVIVCPSSSHAPPSIAAAEAGKAVLVEKPMCTTVREAQAMVEAAERAGVVLMVAYMKRHEPAYRFAQQKVSEMTDVRFIQVNHLHPDNDLHTAEFRVRRFDDIPPEARSRWQIEQRGLIAEALDYPDGASVPEDIAHAYNLILGSMIHDIGNLHGLFGAPRRVVSSEIWLDGRAVSTVLDYCDERRAVASWVDLPDLWDFKETLEVYGSRERVLVSFPTGFARGLPSYVTLHGMDDDATPWRRDYSWHDNPFKLELQHFGECIRSGAPPATPGREAIADIQLVGDIVKTYLRRGVSADLVAAGARA
jgi:predicted dehydrogenase